MKSSATNKKVKVSDKVGALLFEEMITALLNKYNKSKEKETMSFEEYCIALKNLSINQRKNKEKGETG